MFVTHSPREVIEMGDHLTPQDFYEFIDGSLEGYAHPPACALSRGGGVGVPNGEGKTPQKRCPKALPQVSLSPRSHVWVSALREKLF